MKTPFKKLTTFAATVSLLIGCSGTPTRLGVAASLRVPESGSVREVSGTACGFQLLLLIPISVNSRLHRANEELREAAAGDYVTDVQVQESWFYGLVGTGYCTTLKAKAIHAGA